MPRPPVRPFGTWSTPVSAAMTATSGRRFGPVRTSGRSLYWLETRPDEAGRGVIMRWRDGELVELTAPSISVRSRVHEYGGGDFCVHGESVFFSNDEDQRLYRLDSTGSATPITPMPPLRHGWRYADGACTPDGRWLVCVRETHADDVTVTNELVAVPVNGGGPPRVIAGDRDFYAFPRLSPRGDQIVWTCWDAPDMPWDRTELWVARWDREGAARDPRRLAGAPDESVFQPSWSPDDIVHYVSDRSGWWNLYRVKDGLAVALHPAQADFGVAQWNLGLSTYTFLPDGRISCIFFEDGRQVLATIDLRAGAIMRAKLPWTAYAPAQLHSLGERLAFVSGGPTEAAAVRVYDPATGKQEIVRSAEEQRLDHAYVSRPERVSFACDDGEKGHAWYYPPHNPDVSAPRDALPPLLVTCHGGPTANAACQLSLTTQFWTTRGFAVVDVNYRGSSGFGRAYRQALYGKWGVADREDCAAAARALVARNSVDPQRIVIRGASAGGYTALCAVAFDRLFAGATSYYGIADLETLRQQTHKFEASYLERLIGPYPETRERYRRRSPVHFAASFASPVLLLQGAEDRVVPPAQAEVMVARLRANGVRHAYVCFAGEQHGFRRANSLRRALETELAFYAEILGFVPTDPVFPLSLS